MIIGITGGIASGKSTVTNFLRDRACLVIDADQIVRRHQLAGGRLYQLLLDHLGAVILTPDGQLDRVRLGKRFFEDPTLRTWSDKYQGDMIREILFEEMKSAQDHSPLVFMDIPLLFEQGYADWFDEIWVLSISKEEQLQRLMKRDGFDLDAAQARIASQMPLEEKLAGATVILDNSGSEEGLRKQVEIELERLLQSEKEDSVSL